MMSDFDFDELDKAVTSALGVQASSVNDANQSSSPLASDERASANASTRQANFAVPSRASTVSPAVHSRTMQSRRVPRYQEDAAAAAVAPNKEGPISGDASSTPPESGDFAEMNDAVNSIVDDMSLPSSQDGEASQATTETDKNDAPQKPSLPTRRAGRFMDVVHPSSDMKTATMSPRKTPIIAPLPMGTSEDDDSEDVPTSIAEAASNDFVDDASNEDSDIALQNGMNPADVPAPIDLDVAAPRPINTELSSQISNLLGETEEKTTADVPETPAPQLDEKKDEVSHDSTNDETIKDDFSEADGLDFEETPEQSRSADEPQTSPFLEGVTVEKRPLGDPSAQSIENQDVQAVFSTPDKTEDAVDSAPGYQEEVKHPDDTLAEEILPDELSDDLVSIEATESNESSTAAQSPASKEDTRPDELKKSFAKEAAIAVGPTSIAKQYKEKPRTDDTSADGDIFDTKNYHKPIKDDENKKTLSPVVLISLVVTIVVFVAGGIFFAWWSGILSL